MDVVLIVLGVVFSFGAAVNFLWAVWGIGSVPLAEVNRRLNLCTFSALFAVLCLVTAGLW